MSNFNNPNIGKITCLSGTYSTTWTGTSYNTDLITKSEKSRWNFFSQISTWLEKFDHSRLSVYKRIKNFGERNRIGLPLTN